VEVDVELALDEIMSVLAEERPIFHSEADFQLSFGWQIQRHHPDADVRAETRPRRNIHLDLLVRLNGERTAIELKYLPQRFTGTVNGELFEIPSQAAQLIHRYNVLKDVSRVERLVLDGVADRGLVVLLASEPAYWTASARGGGMDAAFHLHDGRAITGELVWSSQTGTAIGREEPIRLHAQYACVWRDFSQVTGHGGTRTRLRYLLLEVPADVDRPTEPMVTVRVTPARPAATQANMPAPRLGVRAGVREEILDAARSLAIRSSDGTFTVSEIIAEMGRRGTLYPESTIRTQVTSALCADAPVNHGTVYPDFRRVERGRYRLA
jgi:hypothetical protein